MREVINGLMYVLSTGCQWRAIPKDLPPRSTVYDYFDLWSWDGTSAFTTRRPAWAAGSAAPPAPIPGSSDRSDSAICCGHSARDRLGLEDVRTYQVHLASKGVAWGPLNQVVCALRFFYGVTLDQATIPERIVHARAPRKLPTVLGGGRLCGSWNPSRA